MAKVMIVEDETLIRFALADALIDAGHVVIECGNVLEAVAALADTMTSRRWLLISTCPAAFPAWNSLAS